MTRFEGKPDPANADRFRVVVAGRFEVLITRKGEGIAVEVFKKGGTVPVASTYSSDLDVGQDERG